MQSAPCDDPREGVAEGVIDGIKDLDLVPLNSERRLVYFN